jgi:hypothetical protein
MLTKLRPKLVKRQPLLFEALLGASLRKERRNHEILSLYRIVVALATQRIHDL